MTATTVECPPRSVALQVVGESMHGRLIEFVIKRWNERRSVLVLTKDTCTHSVGKDDPRYSGFHGHEDLAGGID
jgi:hypothetical protein